MSSEVGMVPSEHAASSWWSFFVLEQTCIQGHAFAITGTMYSKCIEFNRTLKGVRKWKWVGELSHTFFVSAELISTSVLFSPFLKLRTGQRFSGSAGHHGVIDRSWQHIPTSHMLRVKKVLEESQVARHKKRQATFLCKQHFWCLNRGWPILDIEPGRLWLKSPKKESNNTKLTKITTSIKNTAIIILQYTLIVIYVWIYVRVFMHVFWYLWWVFSKVLTF